MNFQNREPPPKQAVSHSWCARKLIIQEGLNWRACVERGAIIAQIYTIVNNILRYRTISTMLGKKWRQKTSNLIRSLSATESKRGRYDLAFKMSLIQSPFFDSAI